MAYSKNAELMYELSRIKLRYLLLVLPFWYTLNAIAVNDNAILADVQSGAADPIMLSHKTLPFQSNDEYILFERIVWGIMFTAFGLSIAILIARRKLKQNGSIEA